MFFTFDHTFVILAFSFLNMELCMCTCKQAEYKINGECCPMCSPGNRVYRHCTEFISTTCIPCGSSTYTDEPNGLAKCLSCTVCDAAQGLRVKTACTQTSNTVCGPLEGFYCIDEHKRNCRYAKEHTKCIPGQYIKQKGTALKDAECLECAEGTYSNGSLQICNHHTKCEDLGLDEITPGTNSSDAQCGQKTLPSVIAGTIAAIVVVLVVLIAVICIVNRKHRNRNRKHTTFDTGKTISHNQSHNEGYKMSPVSDDIAYPVEDGES